MCLIELDGIPISLNNDTAVPIENSDESNGFLL
jgi:hypothetical protein